MGLADAAETGHLCTSGLTRLRGFAADFGLFAIFLSLNYLIYLDIVS
jgi:hypothetical protein